jgi:release factor glutamine methyltransferase
MAEHVVRAELASATAQLALAGVPSPRVDAELLLGHTLNLGRGQLLTRNGLNEADARRFQALVAERARRIPLQHLTGTAPFRHLELAVGPGVFVPRPETELIIDLVAEQLRSASIVVDLCAGSGAIALAVANETGAKQVLAVEQSGSALDWLRRNARERAAAGDTPIEVVDGEITSSDLLAEVSGRVDVVLSNPPYVPERIRAELSREVAYDPEVAVFAGLDGLALMPGVIATAALLLRVGGVVAIEHDDSHAISVPALLVATGDWQSVRDHFDLSGRPRFVTAVRA